MAALILRITGRRLGSRGRLGRLRRRSHPWLTRRALRNYEFGPLA